MFGRRSRTPFKPARFERNHCEMTIATTGGTELSTVLFTGTDDVVNRSTSFPTGAVLTRMLVKIWATDTTPVNGKHQCGLWYRAGASAVGGYIGNWFLTTNPITQDMQTTRANVLQGRPGVHTIVTITGSSAPPMMTCFFKGRKLIHDGDDVILAILDGGSTNWTGTCDYTFIR